MGGAVVSRLIVLVGGTLYPAYGSYKAVKSANVRQYVRWMMYWVVFALFTTVETFTDIFLSWVPFYYELKVGFVIWLLSPYTKGAAFLYRRFVHPILSKREPEIDGFLMTAKERSYATMIDVGSRGINVAANAVVTAAVKGQAVVSDRLKSFSVNDISRLSDDTPIHSMNPSMYNPPMQREVLRRTPDVQRFEVGPTVMQTDVQYQQRTQHEVQGNAHAGDMFPPADVRLPSGGLVMHSSSGMPSPMDDYGAGLGSQYKAYSMVNLSETREHHHSSITRTEQFSTAPPTESVDDSVIPDNIEHLAEEPSYSTLPRQRRKKHRKEKDATSSVRRSKRKAKTHSYHEGSDDEREQE